VALGLALRGLATAAIDVSDGLLGDLGHILQASACGATVDTASAQSLLACAAIDGARRLDYVLAGGDDYELLFTAPPAARAAVLAAAQASAIPVTHIGRIEAAPGLRLLDGQGAPLPNRYASFDHFR
jgi:thiamine-monophosphate kinase